MNNFKITTNKPEDTIELGAQIAGKLAPGDLIALVGELGAGKTVFVKGLAKGIGVADYLHVNSASFVIMKEYRGDKDLYHFDVYRLDQTSFAETLDYEKYFYSEGIIAVEWADKIRETLPEEYLEIGIEYDGKDRRRFEFRPVGEKFDKLIKSMSWE
ncbi:MAG: tRNA (adenosine(37)-N6)-threonylcarbamoyltransferase complex ATPase subunit type 1 TsaE [Candidatus Tantalella remota]|nr:tRNA (adenosine(37)-N6)-threonylcarbamoyltransferase complex ATPase subunit type 1 TsaE [Candidatus Tantalella remota]